MTNVDVITGELAGDRVQTVTRTVEDLEGVFHDESARQQIDPATIVYRVQTFFPVKEGEEGGLFWGTTFLQPGCVGDEYFMTKGHYHEKPRGEYYMTLSGSGALILMGMEGKTRFEPMRPGSLHYITAETAHRVANTGDSLLTFLACWPSDSGYDYQTIMAKGFSSRLRNIRGIPTLVADR